MTPAGVIGDSDSPVDERYSLRFTIQNIAFDCADPYELAGFWSSVVEAPLDEEDRPGDPVAVVRRPEEPALYFQQVPEGKTVKNRVHICLRPEAPREVEADRLLDLGATIVVDHRQPDGTGHIVFADPEGNEFCLVRSTAER